MTSKSEETELETPTPTDASAPAGAQIESEVDDEDDEDEDEDEEKDEKKKKKDKKDKKDKPKKAKIEYEAAMPRDEAVSYFEALVGGLRTGHLEFRQGDKVLVLAPPERLEVEVSAQLKGDKGKVVFEITWSGQSRQLAIVNEAESSPEAPAAAPEGEGDDD
ncbi:amphi-Trp domain-containing protein [Nannocystaceae bacterium ST9]